MFLFDWFRSFLPLHNPIGFGAADFLELALASLGVALVLCRARFQEAARRFAERTGWCMLLLALLPVALRLALLSRFPVPSPSGADDFSYVLLADTLRHFRLANPVHPLHQFFEAVFTLQEPSYSSTFPMGQGLILALGWTLFGHPWAGVAISIAALCALSYWMLRAWTTPGWALTGGLLAVAIFGPLCPWMNLYWGGAVSASAGCLIFGALPRLRQTWRTRDAVLLGAGMGIQALARPFESVFVALAVALFFGRDWLRLPSARRGAALAALAFLPALLLILAQNQQVTGSFTTLPYQVSRSQYGVPAPFTFEPNSPPQRTLSAEQDLVYRAQVAVTGEAHELGFMGRLLERVRFYRLFFLAPLLLALPAFLLALGEWRFRWAALAIGLLALGSNVYPYFYAHYVAAAACLFLLVSVTALDRLSRIPWLSGAAHVILFLCAFQFLFWYGMHLAGNERMLFAMTRYESASFINYGDPEGRIAIDRRLAAAPGGQLVFVRYSATHMFHEWIHNAADPDSAHVVWAADLGAAENEKLRQYYPDRKAWLAEPDARPPLLIPYELAPPPLPVTARDEEPPPAPAER
jgi:hypothetical protein